MTKDYTILQYHEADISQSEENFYFRDREAFYSSEYNELLFEAEQKSELQKEFRKEKLHEYKTSKAKWDKMLKTFSLDYKEILSKWSKKDLSDWALTLEAEAQIWEDKRKRKVYNPDICFWY